MSQPYGVPSKPICRLCPCRREGWPKRHEIPCSLIMKRARAAAENNSEGYVKELSSDVAQEVMRRDNVLPCNDCSQSMDSQIADSNSAADAAESSINFLLEEDLVGSAYSPDFLPPSENYKAYIRDAHDSWGAGIANEFEAGTPAWMNESYRLPHEQSFNISDISERYLSGPPSPSPSLDRSWAPRQRGSVGSPQQRQTPDRPRRQSLPGRQRSLTKIEPYNRSPSKQDQSFNRSPMNKPSPLLADNRPLQFNQRVVSTGQHASRPRQAGEPGEGLLRSQIHRSPIADPRHRSAPPQPPISGRQTPDRYAHLKTNGVRTKSTYASPSKLSPNPLTAVTTSGHHPNVVMPGSTREVWQKLTVPQGPQSNPHFKSPQNDAAEAYIVREAVKKQTTKVCQEIIDRKHSLDLFQQLSPRETDDYEDQMMRAALREKNAYLDELRQQKNKFVAKMAEFHEHNIGSDVGVSSTTPLTGTKDKDLVEYEARQLLQDIRPQQRPGAIRTTVNHNLDMSNTTMNTTGASSVDESALQAQYEEMKRVQKEAMRNKATKLAGKQPQRQNTPQRPNTPVITVDQSSGMTPPQSPQSPGGVDKSRLSVDGEQSFFSENDQSRLAAAEQRRLESNEQSRIMAESMAYHDASVVNGTASSDSMGFNTSGLNASMTGISFSTTGVSLLENSVNSTRASDSPSQIQAKEDYMRRVEEEQERKELEKRRANTEQSEDEIRKVTKHRNSLVLNELLNRVDGISFKTPTQAPQQSTPHSHPRNQRPAQSQDASFYSIPYDISSSPQPEDSFTSVREMHTAMRDPASSYYQTQHSPTTPSRGPSAHSTALGSTPEYQNNSLHQRYEIPGTPEHHQLGQGGPQTPIIIEITTNPTIVNSPHNDSAHELSLLNQSVEEMRGSTEQNRRELGELRELFEGVDLKEMVEVFKKAKNCKCGVLKEEEKAEDTSAVNSSLNTTGASVDSSQVEEEIEEDIVEEVVEEKSEAYTVI